MVYLVSACLVGINCRFDGANSYSRAVVDFLEDTSFVPVCPEVLGGLAVPRPPCRFAGGDGQAVLAGCARIIDTNGNDLTGPFVLGAKRALDIAEKNGATAAILNERSPSCGVREVYIGPDRAPGMGVLTAHLIRAGIRVISDEEPLT